MLHVTDLLEIVGLVLLAVAAVLTFGAPGGFAVVGAGCLWVSYGLSKGRRP
jgi:hypothetical protein